LLSDTTAISNGIRLHGNEFVRVEDSEALILSNGFTMECWFKKDIGGVSQDVMAKGYTLASADTSYGVGISVLSNNKVYFDLYNSIEDPDARYNINSSALTFDGSWVHIVATYDGSTTIKLYIDGSLSATSTGIPAGGTINETHPLKIGSSESIRNTSNSIDDFKFYNKDLSASEVLKNYNSGKSSHS
jgi:hypothetical protein